MTFAPGLTPTGLAPGSSRPHVEHAQANWGWFVALGVGLILAGLVAAAFPFLATVTSVIYIGIAMLVAGVFQIVHAFRVPRWSRSFYWLADGLLYALGGLFAVLAPVLASAVLTLLLAVALIVAGAFRLYAGLHARPAPAWGWIAATGAITLVLGIGLAALWPLNSLIVLGTLLAVDLLFQGVAVLSFGLALRRRP